MTGLKGRISLEEKMDFQTITVEKRADKTAIITMIREKEMNTLSLEMMDEMMRAMTDILEDVKIKVVIITGSGRAFCCGAKLSYLAGPEKFGPLQTRAYLMKVVELFNFIEDFDKPVIAAINGFALGGGAEMSAASDFRIMSDTAKIGVPESKLGVLAGAGGVQRLPRLVGRGKALEMNMLGTHLTAGEAEKCGLLYKRVPSEKLMDACLELSAELQLNSPIALSLIKECVNLSLDVGVKPSMKYGVEAIVQAFGSEDPEEGITAFFEKRPPDFLGRSFGVKKV